MMMVLNRNFTLRTTLGHVIGFKKDEPVDVPEVVVDAAMNVGAQAVDPAEVESRVAKQETDELEALKPEPQGAARTKVVRAAIDAVLKRGSREDFSAAGRPTVDALTKVVGFTVTARERDAVWDLRVAELADA